MDAIVIRGARQHNLKGFDLEIPRNQLVVITGVSGSGKSSLAFDTLFAEGQRRYVESLSTYARQFLHQADKPDVDSIEGLSPAISIEQKSVSKNPRSTVGTVTEIQDYLRLLFSSVGRPHCPDCGKPIRQQTVQQMVDRVLSLPEGTRLTLLAPFVRGKKGEYRKQLAQMVREGFVRARLDGELIDLSRDIPILDKKKKHDIEIVVDRLVVKSTIGERLASSIETALRVGGGLVVLSTPGSPEETLSQSFSCDDCGAGLSEITPRLFSFNSPYGACPTCSGLGALRRVAESKIIADPGLSIDNGALAPWRKGAKSWRLGMIRTLAEAMGFSLSTPWREMSDSARQAVLYGSGGQELQFEVGGKKSSYRWRGSYEGVISALERRYRSTESAGVRSEIEKYMSEQQCTDCGGRRLRREALSVKVAERSIDMLTSMVVSELRDVMIGLELGKKEAMIAGKVVQEIVDRLSFLDDVGVGYLTLDRSSASLSGGEGQRIRLATQIGSKLMGVLYVLDEPSIGLHQRDNARLLRTLKGMRDLGNSVLVVEHDEETMRAADWIIDLGPGAGIHGGSVVAEGPVAAIAKVRSSLTGQYLRGDVAIPIPENRRSGNGEMLLIEGAEHNNLKKIDVAIPLGTFSVVTGVSGSGKSSLIHDVLYRALAQHFHGAETVPGKHAGISGLEFLDKVIAIDQSPIGRTPRSNPATYTKVFAHIRELMAKTPEAIARGYGPGRFSFNVKGGRCEACSGDGQIKIEMHFLPDVYVECEICSGRRYGRETLSVLFKGLSIADILELSIEEAAEFFQYIPAIDRVLATLNDVGLGYLKLGQPSTTLSGGEAQRVKLSTELCKRSTGSTLYLLDEPTTGLHFEDVRKLLELLHRLVDKGNTVIVVEHNLEVIKTADWVLDLGPEGGQKGGHVVVTGPPEKVARSRASHTGAFLKRLLSRQLARER